MDALALLRRAQGVMRVSDLTSQGCSRQQLRKLLAEGVLLRPARGWLALPSADEQLVWAARSGVVLSCVTLAQRKKLWVRKDSGLHVAARAPNSHQSASIGHEVHWGRPVRLREPFALEDSLENALGYIANCQPYEEAHAIWESALNKGLVTIESLQQFSFRGVALKLLDECTPFSDSGLESYVLRRLRSLRLRVVPQAWVLGRRVDFLIEGWLIFEIDGATHTGKQRDADNAFDRLAQRNGYVSTRGSYRQVMYGWPEIQKDLMDILSAGRPIIRAGSRK